jgi:aminoglycoside phosphotransferase (APT) family kinase protein
VKPLTTERAAQVVNRILQERVLSIDPIIGKGSVNKLYIVRTPGSEVVVRMNVDAGALQVYEKERWCMEQAAAQGIPGPAIIAVGKDAEAAYMIQTFVTGDHGEDSPMEKKYIWGELGKYTRIVHSLRVQGFGEMLTDPRQGVFEAPTHDNFDGSWRSFVKYNVESLTENDELINLNVITAAQSDCVKRLFENLLACPFQFGLNHGDISLKNTIVNKNGTVTLLDWGSAEVNIVPHWDLIQLLQCHMEANNPDNSHIEAFLDGYGISQQQYGQMREQLYTLLLLRAFDKLRWAIDRSAQRIPRYADYAKKVLQLVLHDTG